ncbi:MAG: hypothetical protein WKF75_03925 [Singulisphaera sp.]
MADGDVIDVHSYGASEALGVNPRYEANYIAWIAAAQVAGKPLTVTEWNVPYPEIDRFTAPLYIAGMASLQGWDAPMIYNYSQLASFKPDRADQWSTFFDPALTGMMPAAAVAFRGGHVRAARQTYRFQPSRDQFLRHWTPENSASLRTLAETSRVVVAWPALKELPWARPPAETPGAIVVDDLDRDFLPSGRDFVESDTGELRRDWVQGVQTINSSMTQSASGWIGGRSIELEDVTFRIDTKKAVVAVTSLDGLPIRESARS